MKKIIFTVLTASLMLGACTKNNDDLRPECEKNSQGTILLRSYQQDTYRVYINDGIKGTIAPYGSLSMTVGTGTHTLKTVQVDGFIFTPTIFSASVNVLQCNTLNTGF